MNPYDHIEDYLRGRLSDEQKSQFEIALKEDKDLRILVNEFQGVKVVGEGLLEEDLLAMVRRADEPDNTPPTMKRWWLLGLIGVLVVAGGYYTYRYMARQKLINQAIALYERPENRDIVRSADPETMDLLAQGKYYFELNRFEDSEKALLELLDTTTNQDTIDITNYWLGHVYFNMREWEKARDRFGLSDLNGYKKQLELLNKIK